MRFAELDDPYRCAPPIHSREALAGWLLRPDRTAMTVTRYRKKPVEVEAVRWTSDNAAELQAFAGQHFDTIDPPDRGDDPDADARIFDVTHSTWLPLHRGEWLIKGVRGEFYPCADDVFQATYERVPAGPAT
jgi:hypothetical protein